MTRGRKRKHNPLIPAHIDQTKLPRGVYWEPFGDSGYWFTFITNNGRKQRKKVGGPQSKLSELHAVLEELSNIDRRSLGWLLERFAKSGEFKGLAKRTRQDYERYRAIAGVHKTRAGKLGELHVDRLSLPFMQRLFDAMAEATPTKANHLLRYLRRVFAWGMLRGHCASNPCKGVKQAKEARAVHVPTLPELMAVLALAKERGSRLPHTEGSCPPYLWVVMELGYLCRLRGIETITLTDAHGTELGVRTNRRKGSKDVVVKWTPRLRSAWDAAIAQRVAAWERFKRPTPMRGTDRLLIVSQDGRALSKSGLDSAWQRLMTLALAEGVIEKRFGAHALKHRGITDTQGTRADKREASGHKSDSMMDIYDHSVALVEPTAS